MTSVANRDNPSTRIGQQELDAASAGAIATHDAVSDPHPGYLTQAEGDARYAPFGSGGSAFMGASAWNSALQAVANVTDTPLTFNSENGDTNAIHSLASNTSRFVVPVGGAGWWMGKGYVVWDLDTGGSVRYCWWKKNGTRIPSSLDLKAPGNLGTDQNNVLAPILLADGDYLEFAVYQDSGGSRNVGAASGDQRAAASVWRLG